MSTFQPQLSMFGDPNFFGATVATNPTIGGTNPSVAESAASLLQIHGRQQTGTALLQQQLRMRKEIYRYTCDTPLFATAWSNKLYPDKRFRLVVGTLLDECITSNKMYIIELDENVGELVKRFSILHGYPCTATQFVPNTDISQPELFATTSNCLRIFRYHPSTTSITQECELSSTTHAFLLLLSLEVLIINGFIVLYYGCTSKTSAILKTKSSAYSSPLTNLDWNEVDSTLVATCSVDTTCTVWNIETSQSIGHTPSIKGVQKTQLIAHEKPVHDIAFTRLDNGRDQFATAGADGSIRLFDLRTLQHSTILYEDGERRMLNHLSWNKCDPTKLAIVAHDSKEVVILDVRIPCRPMAKFGNHRAAINGITWAPHSTVHLCTAGSDRQALIWQMNHFNRDEPILAYTAESEICQIHWSNNFHQWISICFDNSMEILRV